MYAHAETKRYAKMNHMILSGEEIDAFLESSYFQTSFFPHMPPVLMDRRFFSARERKRKCQSLI